MNCLRFAYCQTSSNATTLGSFFRSSFTGKDPRMGWRTPLNYIIYSEQRDEETGYGYFGARYMDHELMTMWLSVDPMADKYPGLSPYNYCHWNPLKLVDRTGMCADGWQLELTTGLWTKTDLRGGVEFLSGLTGAASFAAASGSRELSFSLMSNGLSTTNLIFGGLIDERW